MMNMGEKNKTLTMSGLTLHVLIVLHQVDISTQYIATRTKSHQNFKKKAITEYFLHR